VRPYYTEAEIGHPQEKPRRAVIVYESAGQAHRAAAEALRSILEVNDDVEVVLQDGEGLESETPGGNPFVKLWNFLIQRGWFRAADLIINHWFRLFIFPIFVVTVAPKVKARLKALRPDAVLSTADVYSRPLGDAAGELGIPFTVMPVEFSIFADLLHPDAHCLCYFHETARAIRRFDLNTPHFRFAVEDHASLGRRLGFLTQWFRVYGLLRIEPLLFQAAGDNAPGTNRLACHVIGPLREPAHHAPPGEPAANKPPQILVVSGSLGGRYVFDVVHVLLAMPNLKADVVAICGRDDATLAELKALQHSEGGVRLECCGYVDDMPDRLRRASVLIARPSAYLFLETILAGLPLLIPARATKNDSGTVDLTRAWRIGETYEQNTEIPEKLVSMLSRLEEYRARLRDLRSRYPESYDGIGMRIREVVWRSVKTP